MHLSANADTRKHLRPSTHTHTPQELFIPRGVEMEVHVGQCQCSGEGKYFHSEGIFSCQQSDRALCGDRRFPWGPWPQQRQGRRGGVARTRRGLWLLVVPRYQEHGECQHLQGGQIDWGQGVTDERLPQGCRWFCPETCTSFPPRLLWETILTLSSD